MDQPLPAAEVLRWYQHDGFESPLPVMCLRWHPDDLAASDRLWDLHEGVSIQGPPPRKFGLRILRQPGDGYSVRLVWDGTALAWEALGRGPILDSCLKPLLAALGSDLWHLLDRPARGSDSPPPRAA